MLDDIDDNDDDNETAKPKEEPAHLIYVTSKIEKKSSGAIHVLRAATDNPQNDYNKLRNPWYLNFYP